MAERRGMNSTHLKNRNRGLVLQQVASEHRISRADITKRIGLTKMAITNIVCELMEDGFIVEKEAAETTAVGRNPVMLDISPHAPKVIGLYISRTQVSVLLTDLKLHILFGDVLSLENEDEHSLTRKIEVLIDAARDKAGRDRILGIGVSSIGPLDTGSGTILNPTNFFGISNYPIVSLLVNRYGLPIILNNDMNASALAEKLFGSGRNVNNFIYLGISNGIGSGIITNGRLYQDNSGFVGEIGHTCINFDGELCSCGNRGCLEVYADLSVLIRKLCRASNQSAVIPQDFEKLAVIPACDDVFRDVVYVLSIALVNAINLLDPEKIIIGHEGAYLPQRYLTMLEDLVNRHILATGYKRIRIEKSSFNANASLFGSACCILSELFSGHIFPC